MINQRGFGAIRGPSLEGGYPLRACQISVFLNKEFLNLMLSASHVSFDFWNGNIFFEYGAGKGRGLKNESFFLAKPCGRL